MNGCSVYPEDKIFDERLRRAQGCHCRTPVLGKGNAARQSDLGDLQYPVEKPRAQVPTTLVAHGDPGNWPFDSYSTEEILWLSSTPVTITKRYRGIEVTGSVEGWGVSVDRFHDGLDDTDNPNSLDDATITLHRSKGQLIFDVAICRILIALPILALVVAIPMALGRTTFLLPFSTWYARRCCSQLFCCALFGLSPPGCGSTK